MIHELKTLPQYFSMSAEGKKNFEVRRNDRDFKVGDFVFLREYSGDRYTGREWHRKIDYILYGGQLGIESGYCILSLSEV